jgi:hypothetical protein
MYLYNLYCAICMLNSKTVNKCSLLKTEVIIDSKILRGCSIHHHKINWQSYENAINNNLNSEGYHIAIETLNKEIILEEIEHMLISEF